MVSLLDVYVRRRTGLDGFVLFYLTDTVIIIKAIRDTFYSFFRAMQIKIFIFHCSLPDGSIPPLPLYEIYHQFLDQMT